MLGHDPGRRRPLLSIEEARLLLRSAGSPEALRLKAAVHPVIQDRYGTLLKALFAVWEELGVTVSVETPDIASYIAARGAGGSFDVGIMRWTADYNDPDNFTHNLFHSSNGLYRTYFSSAETDQILESARRETATGARVSLYQKFEGHLLKSSILVPLFHDVSYRLCSPQVRGLRVSNSYPAVNYAEVGKSASPEAAPQTQRTDAGIIQVPMTGALRHLDPALTFTAEEGDTMGNIYETLMRVQEGRIEPFLATDLQVEEGGRKYRFRLRENVRFHDGRRLTARDVRYSLERMLQARGSLQGYFAVLRGAETLLEGKGSELAGFHIRSATEFTVELVAPVAFFPVLLSNVVASIVPEGTGITIGKTIGEGAVGTGPFRVVRFEPGRQLELERNPSYWRDGYPRSQGLVFSFGVPPAEILSGFRAGRYSVASNLPPADVETLRRDAAIAGGYREAPSLSTYFALFNTQRGPLSDASLRRRLVESSDVAALVRQTLGRRAIPAHGWIPPGLLGHEPVTGVPFAPTPLMADAKTPADVELAAAVHPIFAGEHAAFFRALEAAFRSVGVRIRSVTPTMPEYMNAWSKATVDVVIGRWFADYPDTDTFTHLLSRREGYLGMFCGSPEMDHLVEKGRTEVDPRARHSIYRQVEEIIRRDALMLPLFHEQVYRFARPEVEGLTVSYTTPTVAYEKLRVRRS